MRYNGEYEVIFKGDRKIIQQIPEIMLQIAQADIERKNAIGENTVETTTENVENPKSLKSPENPKRTERKNRFDIKDVFQLDHFPELYYLSAHVETALEEQEGSGDILCRVHFSDHDCGGFYTDWLKELKAQMPNLAIAVLVQYEYEENYIIHRGYSPKGSQHAPINHFCQTMDILPEEDWIPIGWRKPGTTPRYRAEGTIAYLGKWEEPERTLLQKAICSEEWQKACGFRPKEPNQAAVVATDSGFSFALIGDVNISNSLQTLQGLLDLSGYTQAHSSEYTAFCRIMYEKKLLIHVEFHDYSNADWYGNYESSSNYHYLISSDGARLIPSFTRCSTYGWGASFIDYSSPSQYLVPSLYKLSTKTEDVAELSQNSQTLIWWSLFRFLSKYPINALQNADIDPTDTPEKFSFYREEHVMNQVENALQGYFLEHQTQLLERIQRAKEKAVELNQVPSRFQPETFDNRFAGQCFYIDGDLVSYSKEQLKQEIEDFGGIVVGNAAKADYFIYGRGVGNPFLKGLENGVTFLSEDYFEQMTR